MSGIDIVGVAEKLGPLALWIVLIVAALWLLWDKVLGKEGLVTRAWNGVFNRELARARRDAEIEAAQQLRHDARNAALLEENAYLEQELREERTRARAAVDEHRTELADLRAQLDAAHDRETRKDALIAELTRAGTTTKENR